MMYQNAKQALADPRLLKAAAKKLATDGVHGDTILAHIGPQEAALLKARGGVGTINPRSGLPQFYDAGTDGSNLGGGQGDTATTGGDGSFGGANNGTAAAASQASGYGPSAPGMASMNSLGQLSASSAAKARDDAAVGYQSGLGMSPGALTGQNSAQDVMNGITPGLADKALDMFGIDNPGAF